VRKAPEGTFKGNQTRARCGVASFQRRIILNLKALPQGNAFFTFKQI